MSVASRAGRNASGQPRRRRARLAAVPPEQASAGRGLRRAVEAMPDEFVQCRDFGHSWEPFTARAADYGCFESVLRCRRCRTSRVRRIGPRGQVLSSSYDYAEGYQVKGLGRLTGTDRDMLRLASVLRLMEGNR